MNRLRTIAFAVYLAVSLIVIAAVCAPMLLFGEGGARSGVRIWSRSALFGLRAICGVRHVVVGAENIPSGGGVIAANHQSMWETIALLAIAPKPVIVFKRELLKVPIYGWWGMKAGSIPVDREAGPRAIRELSRAATKKISEGCQVIVFPEGTRGRVGEALPLQPGVAAIYSSAGARCTPALHDSGRFWLYPGGVASPKRPGVITLQFLPPIEAGLARKTFQRRLDAALQARSAAGDRAHDAGPVGAREAHGRLV
jgi:1-acyl-sn-glycerol-3-phosphate acyltransferase